MRAGWIKPDFQQSTARNVLKKHLDQTKNKTNFGSIENVTIKYDEYGERARRFAFILFNDKEAIQRVLNVQFHKINQCQIVPKQGRPRRR